MPSVIYHPGISWLSPNNLYRLQVNDQMRIRKMVKLEILELTCWINCANT